MIGSTHIKLKHFLSIIILIMLGFIAIQQMSHVLNHPNTTGYPDPLRIGYAIEAPYAYLNSKPEVTGKSISLAREIAKELGIANIEFIQIPFQDLINSLMNGRVHVVASGLFITPERQSLVSFSHPYLKVYPGLLIRKDASAYLTSESNWSTEFSFGVIGGSAEESMLKKQTIALKYTVFPDFQTAILSLREHHIDGLLLSMPTLNQVHIKHPEQFDIMALDNKVMPGMHPAYTGFAFNHENRDLLSAWNEAQIRVMNSPKYSQILTRYGLGTENKPESIPLVDVIE